MWLGGSVGLRALECPFLNLWRTIRTLEPVPPPVSGPQMWALVVPLVHSQLNHLFFRKREGERGGKGEGAKKGGRKIQPGKKKAKKRNKIFFLKGKEQTPFPLTPQEFSWGQPAGLPVALLLFADSEYTFPFKTGCLQSRGNKPEPPINQ